MSAAVRHLALLLFVALAPATETFAAPPDISVNLDGDWAYHAGDSPPAVGGSLEWASPSLDDSGWAHVGATAFANVAAARWRDGVFWYRQRVAAPQVRDLALEIGPQDGAYEVFVNGTKIGAVGRFPPHPAWYASRARVFPVPAEARDLSGYLLIAVRAYRWPVITRWYAVGMDQKAHVPVLGSAAVLEREVAGRREELVLDEFPGTMIALLCLVVGVIAIELYRRDRTEPQHLWLGLAFLATACDGFLGVISANSTLIPVIPFVFIDMPIVAVQQGSATMFLGSCFSRRPPLVARILAGVFVAAFLMLIVSMALGDAALYQAVNDTNNYWLIGSVILGVAAVAKTVATHQPNALVMAIGVTAWETSIIWSFRIARWFPAVPTVIQWGPFTTKVSDLGLAVFAVCMFYVLVGRFLRLREERELLGQEFEAARRVQALLVPQLPHGTPGYAVDTAYSPSLDVGGDFYQVLPADDGSMLVLVGDVSGKGLRAAMMVAHIVGGLRQEPSRQPGEVLNHLNRALLGQTDGGFVTCGCALIAPNGCVTLANAGHIYPYRNGEELELPSGLPLGLLAESSYPETRVHFEPGDRLTFVSDGVVEARNARGELFGFDRTRALSTKAASEISAAAKAFGQNDDITVVTVSRLAA
jgi:hypothetical protein